MISMGVININVVIIIDPTAVSQRIYQWLCRVKIKNTWKLKFAGNWGEKPVL
jgi:hypothetical protein